MKRVIIICIAFLFISPLRAQDDLTRLFADSAVIETNFPAIPTFKSPRIINGQSSETIHKNDLVFMVLHRFGDIASDFGGINTFYGLDNSTDILIGFNYGITDNLNMGFGRAKGAPNGTNTYQKQLFYLNLKARLLRQTSDDHVPVSLSLFGNSVVSGMEKSRLSTSDANFQSFGDRMSYVAQLIVSRKFSPSFSLEITPTYIRRNYVTYIDMNNLFALGLGGRMKVSHRMALVVDYFWSFRSQNSKDYFFQQKDFKFYNPLGIGLEIETGGHTFNLSFTNSTAILENQFIPSTSSKWGDGGFRWGFSISRTFSVGRRSDAVNYLQ